VFIGEAPGRDEDLKGVPFVGRAGKVLDVALAAAGISRDEVYITNLVKCRPPGNRRPRADEVSACRAHLDAELRLVRPDVVCLLGQTVARDLAGSDARMRELAGKELALTVGGRKVRAFVAYHPAACLYRRENVESLTDTVRLCAEAAGLR
jgi:DNA polymerase